MSIMTARPKPARSTVWQGRWRKRLARVGRHSQQLHKPERCPYPVVYRKRMEQERMRKKLTWNYLAKSCQIQPIPLFKLHRPARCKPVNRTVAGRNRKGQAQPLNAYLSTPLRVIRLD